MERYSSNSYASREEPNEPIPKKKSRAVVSNPAKIKKKSKVQKFTDIFIADDIGNVGSFIFSEVFIPALKKLFVDIMSNGSNLLMYGRVSESSHKPGTRVNYAACSLKSNQQQRANYPTKSRGFDYENLLFESIQEAEEILLAMQESISEYGTVSVQDLYDFADVTCDNPQMKYYGWINIDNAQVYPAGNGYEGYYFIRFPKIIDLKNLD